MWAGTVGAAVVRIRSGACPAVVTSVHLCICTHGVDLASAAEIPSQSAAGPMVKKLVLKHQTHAHDGNFFYFTCGVN